MMSLAKRKATTSVGGKTSESQRGFTLVELAIVLVIIGLIIAAVLKGQELIVSARLKSTISDVDAFRGATNTFQDKYGALPGDYANAQVRIGTPAGITWATLGDGDGTIDGDGIGGAVGDETLLYWAQMAAAGMISGVSPLGTSAVFGDGLPTAPVGAGFTIRNELVINKTTHWLALGEAIAVPLAGPVTAEQALVLDEKADDGRPGTGGIRTETLACTDSTTTVTATTAYDPDPGVAGCLLKFEL